MYESFEDVEKALEKLVVKSENLTEKITSAHLKLKLRMPDYSIIERRRFTFKNNRGLSVVRGCGTYGEEEGLFEIAVLDKKGALDYSTQITDDVIGHCDIKTILKIARKVAKLP